MIEAGTDLVIGATIPATEARGSTGRRYVGPTVLLRLLCDFPDDLKSVTDAIALDSLSGEEEQRERTLRGEAQKPYTSQ